MNVTRTYKLIDNYRLAQVAKGMIALGVFGSHAIYCYVAIDIAWNQYLSKRLENSKRKLLWEYVLRTGIVFLTCKYTCVQIVTFTYF